MDIPLGALVTAIATLVGVILGNRLTYARSSAERLWDLRRQAYGVILTELAAVDRISHNANQYIASGVDDYWEGKYFADDVAKIGAHMRVVRARFSDDYLILSDEFIRLFEKFIADLDSGDPMVAGRQEHIRSRNVITRHRPVLLTQARTETKPPRRWWLFSN